jgi:hypothetical protein
MANPMTTEGMFSWFELMTTDVEGAKNFYGELLGWEYIVDNSSGMEYTMIKPKGSDEPIAGIFDRKSAMVENTDAIPPHWGCYITVNDIVATVSKVKELGGNIIVPPTEIPNIGKFSVIQDPQQAIVSLFEYSMKEK